MAVLALKESRDEISSITENVKIGIWKMEIKKNKITWPSSLLKIFETELTDSFTYEDFLNLIHPEDRQRVNQVYRQSLESKQPYEIVHV